MREMQDIYLASQLICDTYEEQVKNANEKIQPFLIHKVKHTFQVAHEIMDIMFHEKEVYNSFTPQDKKIAELSAVLHDLGRFYQHYKGQRLLPSTEFNHGLVAAHLLKNNPKFNDPVLLFAIIEHNDHHINYENPYYLNLSEKDKKKAEIIAKLLRDADKLDNIRCTVYDGHHYFGDGYIDGPLSEEIKEDIKNHRQTSLENRRTSVDYIAYYLAWINDIYFDYTKKVVKELGFIDCLIDQIKNETHAPAEDIAFLQKYLTL